MAELVIRISGDIKNYEEALSKASKETEGLSDTLSSVAQKSAIAFAALTAEIGFATAAYKASEKTVNQLNQALQNQGIFSKELSDDYQRQALELQNLTGLSDEAIIQAQTSIQAFIGQQAVTSDLTTAIADLAAAKNLDLQSTAELIGKGINGQTGALKKLGIEVDANATKQERLAQIVDQVSGAFGGQAAAAGKGLGSLNILKETFGDFQEQIGKRFVPLIEFAAKQLTSLFQILQNKALVDFIASMLFAGAVITGVVSVVSAAGVGFLALKAALIAANIQISATSLAIRGLVGATGLGLVLVVLSAVLLNWEKTWAIASAVFNAFVNNIKEAVFGVGLILRGIFSANLDDILEGGKKLKEAFAKGFNETKVDLNAFEEAQSQIEQKQNEASLDAANKRAAAEKQKEQILLASQRAANQALLLESKRGSAELIKLKQDESALLKQLAEEDSAANRAAIQQKIADNKALQEQASADDLEQRRVFNEQFLAQNEEFEALSDEQKQAFLIKNQAALQEQILTENQARQLAAQERIAIQTKEHNDFLVNQQKFGTAYALINQIMNSAIIQGSAKAFGELAQLQQSSNSTLKGIGKAAATAQIAIKTAESAMNIYAGFSTIPIVGPALGIAGAAAAVAFGGEQISKVTAAQEGGLLEGGIPGVDSIPVLAQQGELITPRKNFDEVVNAVAAQRNAQQGDIPNTSVQGPIEIILTLKDDLMNFVEAQMNEREAVGVSLRMSTV